MIETLYLLSDALLVSILIGVAAWLLADYMR